MRMFVIFALVVAAAIGALADGNPYFTDHSRNVARGGEQWFRLCSRSFLISQPKIFSSQLQK